MKFCMEIVLRILHSVFLQVNHRIHASMRDLDFTSDRMQLLYIQKNRHKAVDIVTRLWAGRHISVPEGWRSRDFRLSITPRHDPGSIEPSVHCLAL